ncbi:MAG: hypothetical protein KTR20_08265 [Cellvibrionaceae bacterium]|nr:hypothetical protein [Cellvibrionaceae bacterium]
MKPFRSLKSQQGVMLIVSLIMLLVMTMVGVTTMGNATLQERMAGNSRLLSAARLNAEGALRQAELLLGQQDFTTDTALATFFATEDDGLELSFALDEYDKDVYRPPVWDLADAANWSATNSTGALGSAGATAPRFRVEYIGRFDDCGGCKARLSLNQDAKVRVDKRPYVFRVMSIGYGADDNIFSVLESIYMTQQGVTVAAAP